MLLSVLSGFIFIGPLLAFGMYSVSRQLCLGNRPDLFHTLKAARKPFANALVFALVLLVIFLLWARAGMMVSIFFPTDGEVNIEDLVVYLGIGSAVGSIFASICFAASVFSLPFIANRDVDVITAVVSSINAVLPLLVLLLISAFLLSRISIWLTLPSWAALRNSLLWIISDNII